MNTVKLSDTHLGLINKTLAVYYRLKSGQIDIALDFAYGFKLNHKQSKEISDTIRKHLFPELKYEGSSYSFNSPQIGDATIAYEILKTFEEFLAAKRNDGYYGCTVDFHGPLKASGEPLPVVLDHKNYKDFPLSIKNSKIVCQLIAKKDYEKVWNHIDSLNLDLPKGDKTEIITESPISVVLRITKPRKKNDVFFN
jgi:hypothetical protein